MKNHKIKETIKITVRPAWEASKGHANHRSGAGHHADRRTKRSRTRQAAMRAALED